jgi:hypothetical protein
MTRTLLPEIHTPETLAALADAVLAVLGDWGVAPAKQVELLGLAAPQIPGQPLPDDPGVLERAGHLLAIERALKRRYPEDPAARHAWLMLPESGLGARAPLRVMLDGVEGIKRARSLLETGAAAPARGM